MTRGVHSPPARSRRCRLTRWCSRSGRTPTATSCARFPVSSSNGTRSWSTDQMMTGHPGIFAGGDMVPAERTVTVAVGHGKRAAPLHRCLAARRHLRQAGLIAAGDIRHAEPAGVQRRRSRGPGRHRRAGRGFDEVLPGSPNRRPVTRRNAACRCGNCFECDNCYAACPEDAIIKLGRGQGYRVDYARVHRLRRLLRAMPVPRHRHGRRTARARRRLTAAPEGRRR